MKSYIDYRIRVSSATDNANWNPFSTLPKNTALLGRPVFLHHDIPATSSARCFNSCARLGRYRWELRGLHGLPQHHRRAATTDARRVRLDSMVGLLGWLLGVSDTSFLACCTSISPTSRSASLFPFLPTGCGVGVVFRFRIRQPSRQGLPTWIMSHRLFQSLVNVWGF